MKTIAISFSLSLFALLLSFNGTAWAGNGFQFRDADSLSEGSEASAYSASHGQLNVLVEGLDSEKGDLKLLLFNRDTGFPFDSWNAMYQVDIDIETEGNTVVFKSIPFGEYAIFVYHDENGNGKFDKSWTGAAKEGFGYSNRNGSSRVAPLYSQSKFNFDNNGSELVLELVHAK